MSTTRSKLKDDLFPLFNHFAKERKIIDLQGVFQRFMVDTTFILVAGSDPRTLSIEMPKAEFSKALDDVGEVLVYRHITPRVLWKLQNWLGIGKEKKMIEASATFDRIYAKHVSAKREELRSSHKTDLHDSNGEDMLASHIKLDTTKYKLLNPNDDKFLRDVISTLMLAGKEATASALTWFFWLLSQNPKVVGKILHEIDMNLPKSESYDEEFLNKLVYLHGALYEAMRLYPPIPFERKTPIKQDVLPSGQKVEPNSNIMIFMCALGRMRSVWGEDATEFKPERWVTESGGLKHRPSSMFFVFSAGPRNCLGKKLAMKMMKTVVIEVLTNYDIKIVDGQKIEPVPGLALHMKHGLKVTISKRCSASK